MDFFVIVALLFVVYHTVYLIIPIFLDCNILLALKEKYGKPVCK